MPVSNTSIKKEAGEVAFSAWTGPVDSISSLNRRTRCYMHLICCQIVSVPKEYNVQCHFLSSWRVWHTTWKDPWCQSGSIEGVAQKTARFFPKPCQNSGRNGDTSFIYFPSNCIIYKAFQWLAICKKLFAWSHRRYMSQHENSIWKKNISLSPSKL